MRGTMLGGSGCSGFITSCDIMLITSSNYIILFAPQLSNLLQFPDNVDVSIQCTTDVIQIV